MKVALLGYGKMGKAIEQRINAYYPDMEIVLKIQKDNAHLLQTDALLQADIAIEFSAPHLAYTHVMCCFEKNIPVVCGTTGWYEQLNIVKQLCNEKNYSLLYATNFSIGVNVFFELNKKLATLMQGKNYNVRVDETHHVYKLDKPSGTAYTLTQDILHSLPLYEGWSLDEEKDNYVPVFAHRKENVPGTHCITYQNEIDQIQITHTAYSREGFADGAIQAARFLLGKKGYFEMRDLLQF